MKTIQHKFVEFIPEALEEGILYISLEYATALHKCACGCGREVVTPLSPKDWKMIFDGKSVSLYPSIGNWQFPCRSHYWIENSQVVDANKWAFKTVIPEKMVVASKVENQTESKTEINAKRKKKKRKWLFF
jgi:hypothetical protein